MHNRRLSRLYSVSASIMLILMLLSLTDTLFLPSRADLDMGPVAGAIWTSDPNGERVNGNLYTNPRKVYLAGGPHKETAAGLPDGIYYFQVTDPAGKLLLSKDAPADRMFTVENGYITSSDPGTHSEKDDTTRGYGVVVQLWPFTFTPKNGGVYKVWVTREDHYDQDELEGCFGFIPSLSKTDNFKVKLSEDPKYFELWVTEGISLPPNVQFYVNYTVDGDGNAGTFDPVRPWINEQLIYDRTEGGYGVFRDETSFPFGTYIYWQFIVLNTFTLISDIYGPELIELEGMVNKETLFMVNGHKYDFRDGSGLEGWTVELYKDDVKIAETQTDAAGYYELIGIGTGDFKVCEVPKSDEGWANATSICHEFNVDDSNGDDHTFDFYNYKMLRLTDTSNYRCELSSFHPVFTPSNDGSGMYKLSSTNPGSFYVNVVKYGTAGGALVVEVGLPPDQENADFDSPNFILHHTYIGSTPVIDVHVYAGRQEVGASPCGSEWVPDWESDITSLFEITSTVDGKNVTIAGNMPDTGEVFVTVHIDYQISALLTWEQVQMFTDPSDPFEYTFSDTVYFSIQGVTRKFNVE